MVQVSSPLSAVATRVQWESVGCDCYRVRVAGETIGYVDVVGRVFVVLLGPRYDRAVEITQCLVFEQAIDALHRKADIPTNEPRKTVAPPRAIVTAARADTRVARSRGRSAA
jgi:hypothetical protein